MTCICCKDKIKNPNEVIVWVDGRRTEGQKEYDEYMIHISCFNGKNYKGLHQDLKPGEYD